jgi:hypothetical protein
MRPFGLFRNLKDKGKAEPRDYSRGSQSGNAVPSNVGEPATDFRAFGDQEKTL